MRLSLGSTKRETIKVKDPDGHLAKWLGVEWAPGAELTVVVKGSFCARRRLRRDLRRVAEGQ